MSMRISTVILVSITILSLALVGYLFLAYNSDRQSRIAGEAPAVVPNFISIPQPIQSPPELTQSPYSTGKPWNNEDLEPDPVANETGQSDQTQATAPAGDGLIISSSAASTNSSPAPAQTSSKSSNEPKKTASPIKLNNGIAKLPPAERISHRDFQNDKTVVVIIDKKKRQTYILQDQDDGIYIVYESDNAIGDSDSPTPAGPYKVASKTTQPTWVPPKSIDPEQKEIGPYKNNKDNPLGVAAVRLNKWNIVLHGTNNPASIGKKVSHGCIRHRNDDIMRIYNTVDEGTTVIVTDSIQGTQINKSMFAKEKSS
jgi:lipoprotein-anchoring transpeptidase ErfK/SrfK